MKKILLSAIATVALPAIAFAADLPARTYTKAPVVAAPVAYNWTGFYVGAHVGGGWASNNWYEDATVTGAGGVAPAGFPDAAYNASGVIGGGQIGYNYQSGWAVFGVEGDVSGTGIKGSGPCFPEVVGTVQSCSTNIRWLGTVTGRLGVAFNSTLLYVKGGWAWAKENLQNACDICNGGPVLWQSADNRNGGTVGVGVEYGFTPNWSAKLEYDHIAFGKQNVGTFTNAAGFSPFTEDIRQNINLVKVGANYRFGGPVVAQY
jgi:outer membrane immunogenic protein